MLKKIQRENKPRIIDDSNISLFIFTLKDTVNQHMQKFNVIFCHQLWKWIKKLWIVMILLSYAINGKYYYYVIINNIFLLKAAHHVLCTFYTEPSKGRKNVLISENNDTNKNSYV